LLDVGQIHRLLDSAQLGREELASDPEQQEVGRHAARTRARSSPTAGATPFSGTTQSAPASRRAAFGIPYTVDVSLS
jgi:hypothetical protein